MVFEGGDAVGKSTQVKALVDWVSEQGVPVVATFEPGDTPIGRTIRRAVLDPGHRRPVAPHGGAAVRRRQGAAPGRGGPPGPGRRSGRRLRPVRRLDAGLPGRRPGAGAGRARVGRPLGHRGPPPAPDRAAGPRPRRGGGGQGWTRTGWRRPATTCTGAPATSSSPWPRRIRSTTWCSRPGCPSPRSPSGYATVSDRCCQTQADPLHCSPPPPPRDPLLRCTARLSHHVRERSKACVSGCGEVVSAAAGRLGP